MVQHNRTALILDDCPEDRELYSRYLSRDPEYSYTILEASLGQQGLELWQQHQPDVVLLDYRLPDLDGLEFLDRLQSPTPQPCFPVLVITGQGNEAIAVKAIKAGAQDYLIKEQLTPEGLHLAVNGAIETVRLRTQLQQRIEREHVVAQITRQIHQSLSLDDILQTTVSEVHQFLHTDRVLVFRLHPDGNGTVVAESVGAEWRSLLSSVMYDPCLAANYLRFSRPGSITHDPAFAEDYVQRYRQGMVTAIDDLHASGIDPCHVELLASFQVQANLVVPILHDDQFWGLLIAHHCTSPRSWQPLEIDLLKELATQVSIALRQAELYEQAQHELVERRSIELSLRESEKRYATLAQVSPVGIFRTDVYGDCQYVNERWCELAGLTFEDAQGNGWISAIHPDDRDRVAAAWYRAATSNLPFRAEYRFQTPDGIVSWLVGQAVAEKDFEGTVIGYVGTVTNITDRKHAEEALQESEERLRLALEASRMGTWDWNIQTGHITWSENLEALFGLAPGAFDGSYEMFASRLHPDDRDRVQLAVHHAITTGADYNLEFRTVYLDGTVRWAMTQGKVFYDANGQPVRMAGIDLDITERKRSEVALKESEERFRQFAENIEAVFWMKEALEGRVSYVSPAYERLWGLNPQALYDKPLAWIDHIHPDDRAWSFKAFHEKAAAGQFDEEYRLVLADGSTRWVRDRCFPLRNETGAVYRFAGIAEDITDRKAIEEALRKNEALLRLALTGAQAGSWDWELATDKLVWSPETFNLYGLAPEQGLLQYQDWHNTLHPDDREQTVSHVSRVIEQRQANLQVEFRIIHPQKGVRWLLALGRLTLNEQGESLRLSGINLDITDRKQTEEALRQSEEFKRRILDSSSDCIKLLDLNGRLLYMNTGGLCLLEIDDITPYLNAEWTCLWQEADRSTVETAINAAKAGEIGRFQGFCPTAKGTHRWWDVIVSPIFDTTGQVAQILATSRDITDRRQSEEALRQSEERYRTLFESMEDGFCVIEMLFADNTPIDYRFLEANPAFRQQTGLEQAVGQTACQLLPDLEAHWFELYGRVARTGEPMRFENGSDVMNRWFDVYAFRIGQPENCRVAILFKDISERKAIETEREQLLQQEQTARETAERANRIKDEFLAILSHELRSPLNPILGWTKLLQTRKFDETKTAEALATIERNAKLQTQLIDDLLDMAKVLRGKLSLTVTPVNPVFVIESAIDTVRTAAVSKAILLHPELPKIGQVSGDATRLQQIVWNLLSNAIKFTPSGGQVNIRLMRVNDQARLIVSDTGKGINPNFLPHIFESFRQEDVSITRQYGGLGLGLAIVRQLVEAHGGTIAADSPGEGQGATFTVNLPLLNLEPEPIQANVLAESEPDLMGIRVLTVDDNPDARELLTVILTEYGAEVVAVSSAADVFIALESFQPDLLVSDIGMPEVDGYTLLQQLRSRSPENGGQMPAIALTAYAGEVDQQRATRVGFQRHLTKPIDPGALAQAVAELVRGT